MDIARSNAQIDIKKMICVRFLNTNKEAIMENRYKFRVFDTVLKQMSYGFAKHICAEDGTEFVTFGFSFTDGMNTKVITLWEVLNDKRYVVMQCTSQTDKNKKPIYEGDIIHCKGINVNNGNKINKIMEIKDIRELHSDYNLFNMIDADFEIEIIGNKFEHPHLLKGDK